MFDIISLEYINYMHLKKLELSGFKSFARRTTLEFTKGITAVVGPNGSGKSNVADGIRWVMGEQSIKTLRGKRSEDVIFSGSDKKGKLGMAEVSLELDNSDKKVPIDYSELLITRRLYRSGDSDYLINGGKSKLSDINMLLTKANFGHRTYSVIGQGMIDNFLIATPQERKEFFDEASGVKQFQIKKNQSMVKMEAVWDNLKTLKIKTGEMEPQLQLLTRQVKKLEKRKEVEVELKQLKQSYYSSYWQEIEANYLSQKKRIDEIEEERNKKSEIWKNLESQVNTIAHDNQQNEKIEKLRNKQTALIDKKMKIKEEIMDNRMKIAESIRQVVGQVKNISRTDIDRVNRKLEEINLLHKKLSEVLDREQNIEFIKKEIFGINKKIDELIQFIKPFIKTDEPTLKDKPDPEQKTGEDKIKKLEKEIAEIDKNIIEIQTEIKKLTAEDQQNRSGLWQLQQDYQKAQTELNVVNASANEARVALARTETKRFDLKREIDYEMGGIDGLAREVQDKMTDQERIIHINRINKLKAQLEMVGGIDPEIEAEYKTTKSRYDFLISQMGDLERTIESLKKLVGELDLTIKKQMEKSFHDINKYFQKYFKVLFEGGKAELVLIKEKELVGAGLAPAQEDEDQGKTAVNFFQEKSKRSTYAGIEVQATPPGKKLKSINALSGGERALTSIALICAIISSNPSPFVVLDEVDAALDESNSIRFAQILADLSHKTQFIVITHNRATMEKAKLLYGVTMSDDGVSKLVSLKLEEAGKSIN